MQALTRTRRLGGSVQDFELRRLTDELCGTHRASNNLKRKVVHGASNNLKNKVSRACVYACVLVCLRANGSCGTMQNTLLVKICNLQTVS